VHVSAILYEASPRIIVYSTSILEELALDEQWNMRFYLKLLTLSVVTLVNDLMFRYGPSTFAHTANIEDGTLA
jgi:hypothetical protein